VTRRFEKAGPGSGSPAVEGFLAGRAFPWIAGAITAAVVAWVWSAAGWQPIFHDEAAYLLQAGIFGHGRWADPAPPLPEFFEQMHVLVTPVRAAKYFPGQSLLLAPAAAAGVPAAVPLLLAFGSASLLVVLARRLANGGVALFTWLVWLAAPGGLRFRPSFLSEVTTDFLWLAGWWALLRWWESGRTRFLVTLAACVGWAAITRPLTALLYAIPVGAVVLGKAWAERRWRALAPAALAGVAILGLVPLWSARTTGSWRTTPLAIYTRTYLPFDRLGFSADATPPRRSLPPDMQATYESFRDLSAEHARTAPARVLAGRVAALGTAVWGSSWPPLAALSVVGLFVLPRRALPALLAAVLLPIGYVLYSHTADWSVYYLECHSVLAFLTALGLWAVVTIGDSGATARGRAWRTAAAAGVAVTLAALVLLRAGERLDQRRSYAAGQLAFRRAVAGVSGRSVVFVRYGPGHDPHRALVSNPPDLERAPVWIAHDRGGEDARLIRLARDRTPYLYDEARGALVPLPRDAGAVPP
jgi:hypothetical protein